MKDDTIRAGFSAIELTGIYYSAAITALQESQKDADAARNRAERAEIVCRMVVQWAENPINNGGNPYSMDFVKESMRVLGLD